MWISPGASGGVNGADAIGPLASAAEKVCCIASTGAHGEPSEYCTFVARVWPPADSDAVGTSIARLNSRTAEALLPVGGTNDAAIVSTFVGCDGGHASLHSENIAATRSVRDA